MIIDDLIGLFQVIAEHLSVEEVEVIKDMFALMDTDKDGKVTYDELKAGLRKVGSQLGEPEIKMLMEVVNSLFYTPQAKHFFVLLFLGFLAKKSLNFYDCAILVPNLLIFLSDFFGPFRKKKKLKVNTTPKQLKTHILTKITCFSFLKV